MIVVVGAGVGLRGRRRGDQRAPPRAGSEVTGAVLRADDAVLVANRLTEQVPVVDEVALVDKVPLGMLAAVEVAGAGPHHPDPVQLLRDRHRLRARSRADPA